jgi:two-component system NtrC family response regulator
VPWNSKFQAGSVPNNDGVHGLPIGSKIMRVLLAEDEETIVITLRDALEEAGFEVMHAADTDTAIEFLEKEDPDVVLTDIRMPGEGGMAVLRKSISLDSSRQVIVMTGFATVDQAVEAMRIGAANYVQKPVRNDALVTMVKSATRVRALEAENQNLRDTLVSLEGFDELIGKSKAMTTVFQRIRTVAATDATVLIDGESGTGKERVARALHKSSSRSSGPFVAISCGALPESLLESELFGHERGAFTDAHKLKRGRFELADGGSLFLDDIDDMPKSVQVKLLRVLQERVFERVGGEQTRPTDIRVIAATKISLRDMVRAGDFREDLFYRINVVPIVLPPLRDRSGDVALLAQHLIERHGAGRAYKISAPTIAALDKYPWPGNVRELENAIQRGIALAGDTLELARENLLPLDNRWRGATEVFDEIKPLREVVRLAEIAHIESALASTGGHRTQTAKLLGISRKVLWEKLRDFDIDIPGED